MIGDKFMNPKERENEDLFEDVEDINFNTCKIHVFQSDIEPAPLNKINDGFVQLINTYFD